MTTRKTLTFLITLLFSIPLFAQQQNSFPVSGKVIDKSGAPIPYATVAFYKQSDSTMANGTSTDQSGQFEVQVPVGRYYVKISFLSYQSKFIPQLQINAAKDLGTITLKPASKSLDEVVVKEQRNKVNLKLDKKVYNVDQNLSSKGGNVTDILGDVPSVTVDMDGGINLRGSQNVRLFINGKPSGLVSSSDPQTLRQLQGNLVKRIEVITNPSAKYDAEGEVGIINIVLKDQDKSGLHGSFDVNTGYPHDHGAAINLNYRKDWFNIFISEGVSWDRSPGGGYSLQEYDFPDTSYSYERQLDQTRSDLSNNLRLGADFYLSPDDIITFAGTYQYSTGNNTSTTTYKDFNEAGDQVRTIKRYQDEKEVSHEVEFELSYEKDFKQKDRKLTTDVKYNLEDDREKADYRQNNITKGSAVDLRERSDNVEYETSWLFQSDYVHPFGNKGKLETGVKAHLRQILNDYTVESRSQQGEWQPIPRYDNKFVYIENIYAAYATASEKWGAFSAKGGLRAEYADIRTELVETNETNPRSYLDFFPTAAMSYKLDKYNTLQLSYSRRISRPDFWNLVPFFQYADSRNYRSGNPDLNPEYTNSFESGYQRQLKKGSFLTTIYYRYRTGVIEDITYVEENGITRHKPINLATEHDYGIEFSMNYELTDWWRANGNINGYRAITEGTYNNTSLFSDTYTWNGQFSTKFAIGDRIEIQPSFQYRAPRKTTQGLRKSSYALDIGSNVDVLNNKGTITLNISDIFNTRKRRWITRGEHFRTEGEFQWHTSRRVRLSFTYNLDKRSQSKSMKSQH